MLDNDSGFAGRSPELRTGLDSFPVGDAGCRDVRISNTSFADGRLDGMIEQQRSMSLLMFGERLWWLTLTTCFTFDVGKKPARFFMFCCWNFSTDWPENSSQNSTPNA